MGPRRGEDDIKGKGEIGRLVSPTRLTVRYRFDFSPQTSKLTHEVKKAYPPPPPN